MFGACKVCQCKSEQIADLKAQLETQTTLVRDLVAPRRQTYPSLMLEANTMLDGAASEQVDPTPQQLQERIAVEQQASEMLSGQYN